MMLSPTKIYRSKLSLIFGTFSFVTATFAFVTQFVALVWVSIAFGWVAISYAKNGTITGKRNGEIPIAVRLLLAPYLLLLYTVWRLQGVMTDEKPYHVIEPLDLYLGRYTDRIPNDATLVVDLTSEFTTPKGAFDSLSVPALDAVGPLPDELDAIIERIDANEGMTYLHCASGHGRSGLVAAALLISRGVAENGQSAITHLKRIRPGVGLSPAQKRTLEKWLASR